MDAQAGFDPERIPVQTTTTLKRGSSKTEETVFCPGRDLTVSLTTCLECNSSDGIIDEDGFRYVRCRRLARPHLVPRSPAAATVPQELRVRDVMSAEVESVRDTFPLKSLVDLLLLLGVHAVPVVDGDRRPLGIVSQTNLMQHLRAAVWPDAGYPPVPNDPGFLRERASYLPDECAKDVMHSPALTVSEAATIPEAASLMASHGYRRLPVTSDDGKLVGMVSAFDLVRWLAKSS